jgi:hypothetical protein
MDARRALRTAKALDRLAIQARIDRTKRSLGERGPAWWTDGEPDYNRHLVKNTPYATWYTELKRAVTLRPL